MTDDFKAYDGLADEFADHKVVNHGQGEYVNGNAHTNTLEGWFALLKRGVTGTFHHVSEEHLDRYVDEFAFRYNNREITDGERTVQALRKVEGKRLMYKDATIALNKRLENHEPIDFQYTMCYKIARIVPGVLLFGACQAKLL